VKKTPQNEDALVQLIEGGLSLTRAAQSLGMHHKTAHRWKKEDEEFATRVEQAEARFIGEMIGRVAEAAKTDWRAGVELLARRFPSEFSKPEARLAITQVNVNADSEAHKATMERMAKNPNFPMYLEKLKRRIENRQRKAVVLEVEATEASGFLPDGDPTRF